MFYVVRHSDGSILSVSRVAVAGSEAMAALEPDIAAFFGQPTTSAGFDAVDAGFVRVLEDLIDTLISKGVIRHTDLPDAAQKKLLLRKGLRSRISGALDLLGTDERIL
jgi:hypothetical protein